MQRIKWVDQRLEEWALWSVGAGQYRCIDYGRAAAGDAVNAIELTAEQQASCVEIDQAIARLPTELKDVVFAFYMWGGGMSQITEKLRVTRATVHRRLCHVDIRIVEWFEVRSKYG